MSGLRFLCLGVGDAHSRLWYSSALAVESGGAWLLVDCPHPIRKILGEMGESAGIGLDVGSFAGVALTHLHADHASGLEGFAFFNHFALKTRTVLLAHPDVSGPIWERHLGVTMSRLSIEPASPPDKTFADYFDLRDLAEDRPTTLGPFEIECRRTLHPIPTFALRIQAGGRCLGCSADTSFDPSLLDWLASADLIVHETNLGIHTPYEKLAALPGALRQKMRLTHYPDDFDRASSVIEPLIPGRLHDV